MLSKRLFPTFFEPGMWKHANTPITTQHFCRSNHHCRSNSRICGHEHVSKISNVFTSEKLGNCFQRVGPKKCPPSGPALTATVQFACCCLVKCPYPPPCNPLLVVLTRANCWSRTLPSLLLRRRRESRTLLSMPRSRQLWRPPRLVPQAIWRNVPERTRWPLPSDNQRVERAGGGRRGGRTERETG